MTDEACPLTESLTPPDAVRPVSDLPAASWGADLALLLRLAGPIVLTTAAETMLSFVDFVIASQVGPTAQAAVQSGTLVFMAIYGGLLGVMLCVTTVVSQSFGADRPRDCSAYAWQGVWLSLIYGGLALLAWPAIPALYGFLDHEPLVQAMEVDYTRVRLLSLWAAGASLAVGNYFAGIQQPGRNTITVVGANVVNGVLSWGLVFGRWGLPEMGVVGIAWGSAIATVLRLAWLLGLMCLGRSTQRFAPRATIRWDADKMRRLLAIGWASGVTLWLDIAAWAFFLTYIIGQFGTEHLAASATCWRFTELSFMPALGIGFAVCTLVGNSIGEGRPDLARRRTTLGALVAMLYMGGLGVVFLVAGRQLMSLFSGHEAVIAIGAQLLVFAALFQLFDAAALTYSNALRGAGDTVWPMVVGVLLIWTVLVGGSTWVVRAHPEFGSAGAWAFAALFVISLGTALWWRWRGGRWETIDVIGRGAPAEAVRATAMVDAEVAVMDPAVAEGGAIGGRDG